MYSTPPGYSVPQSWQKHSTIIDLLGETFRLYKRNLALFLILALLAIVPSVLLTLIFDQTQARGQTIFSQFLTGGVLSTSDLPRIIISGLIEGVFSIIVTGAISLAVHDTIVLGQQPTLGSVLNRLVPRMPTLIMYALLISAITIVPTILSIIAGRLLLFIVGLPLLIFVLIRLMFWSQVIVLEGKPAGEVWSRTLQLTRGAFWRLLILTICVVICVAILGAIIGAIAGAVVLSTSMMDLTTFAILVTLLAIPLTPISIISQVVLYFDQRNEEQTLNLGAGR